MMQLSSLFFQVMRPYALRMTDESPSGRYTRLMVRISEELRRKLEHSALGAGRSLSAEMLLRIERSFDEDSEAKAVAEKVEDHEQRLDELWRDIDDLRSALANLQHR